MSGDSDNALIKGEGRVISVNHHFGLLAARNVNGKILIVQSSMKTFCVSLTDVLKADDIVIFEAMKLVSGDKSGAKFAAIEGTVKLVKRGGDSIIEGEGKILSLDVSKGRFGFVEASEAGNNIFFNQAAVRPATTDVNKVLKVGQRVKFRALPNEGQGTSKWRATLVCPWSKAAEFMPKQKVHDTAVRTKSNSSSNDHCAAARDDWITVSKNSFRKTSFDSGSVEGDHVFETDRLSTIKPSCYAIDSTNIDRNSSKSKNFDLTPNDIHCRSINIKECFREYSDISRRIVNLAHHIHGINCEDCLFCESI